MACCNGDSNIKVYTKEASSKVKGLFSRCHLAEGDMILQEPPIVSSQFSWNKKYNYTACANCLKSLETAQNMGRRLSSNYEVELPYTMECCESLHQQEWMTKCLHCQEMFCCEECFFDAKDKYHPYMCANDDDHPISILDNEWRNMHYPPERTSIMLIAKLIAIIVQSNDGDATKKLDGFVFPDKQKEEVINRESLGDDFKEKLKQLYKLLKEAIPLSKGGMDKSLLGTLDGFTSLFAMILMNGQMVETSSLAQYVHNLDALELSESERLQVDDAIYNLYDDIAEETGQFVNCEGIGLFEWRSKCNHSCVPNAEVTFPCNNDTMVLVALQDIAPDEEIFVSYLNGCQLERSGRTRTQLLWKNFAQECFCTECEGRRSESSESEESE